MEKEIKGFVRDLVSLEKKPVRGLLVVEWVVMAYLALTLLLILFLYTKLPEANLLVMGRIRVLAMTAALWLVYRLWPSRVLPNLDHVFATLEQTLFGCQPALLFHEWLPSPWFSEAFDMGYFSYYPMIALTVFYYFFCRPREFERASSVVMISFFLFYLIFIFVPVVGPTFYYHVGISTVCMILVWHARNYKLLLVLAPFYILLCCATVYIQAHYLVDALVGLPTGALFFALSMYFTRRMGKAQ